MTWADLKSAISIIIYNSPKRIAIHSVIDFEKKPVCAYFDFPLIPGGPNKFKVEKITDEGIMLRNDSIERPLGH
jgi:hypothetical protein